MGTDGQDQEDQTGAEAAGDALARARALALLESTYVFPCVYDLTVIALNREPTTLALKGAVAGESGEIEHRIVESRAGKYLSHRFSVRVVAAADVLEIYARVRLVEGVVTLL